MSDVYNVTTAKAKLSAIISDVEHKHKKAVITRRGKNIAVIMPFEEFINKQNNKGKSGLILAEGALADVEDFSHFVDDIYQAREKGFERIVKI